MRIDGRAAALAGWPSLAGATLGPGQATFQELQVIEIKINFSRHTTRNSASIMPHRRPKTNSKNGSSSASPTPAPAPSAPSSRAGRVRIARRVGASFSPRACMLGFGYFARDAVELARVTEDEVDAVVRGRRTHEVALRAAPDGFGELRASCTCTPTSLGASPCRHLWAALLEVDRRGALACLRRSAGTLALADLVPPKTAKAPDTTKKTDTTEKKTARRPKKKRSR